MRPITRFAHLMSSVVQVAALTSQNSYGKATYSTSPVSYRAHLMLSPKSVVGVDGQLVTAQVTAHLMSRDRIDPRSQVTLSTADVGSTESYMTSPRLVGVKTPFDQGGPHHTVLYMSWNLARS